MTIIPTFFCPREWESMTGSQESRFCSTCNKFVYNLERLSLEQRLDLLSNSPGLCGQYRVALRRPRVGAHRAYMAHLIKYGAGVATASGALLVFWQWAGEHERISERKIYRVVAPSIALPQPMPMPEELYEQRDMFTLGAIAMPPQKRLPPPLPLTPLPTHIDLEIDDSAIKPKHS